MREIGQEPCWIGDAFVATARNLPDQGQLPRLYRKWQDCSNHHVFGRQPWPISDRPPHPKAWQPGKLNFFLDTTRHALASGLWMKPSLPTVATQLANSMTVLELMVLLHCLNRNRPFTGPAAQSWSLLRCATAGPPRPGSRCARRPPSSPAIRSPSNPPPGTGSRRGRPAQAAIDPRPAPR
jgi:hypothetical protein